MEHMPTVIAIEPNELLDFCMDSGYSYRVEADGSLLIPPDFYVGITDWERSLRLRCPPYNAIKCTKVFPSLSSLFLFVTILVCHISFFVAEVMPQPPTKVAKIIWGLESALRKSAPYFCKKCFCSGVRTLNASFIFLPPGLGLECYRHFWHCILGPPVASVQGREVDSEAAGSERSR